MAVLTWRPTISTTLTGRASIARKWSYLCDRLWNQICDRLWNPFIVYDPNGDIAIWGTLLTGRIIPS